MNWVVPVLQAHVASAAVGMLLIACGRIGFDGASIVDASSDAAPPDIPFDGVPGYRATAVRFATADNDFIWTGSLENTTNSKRGTYSAWFRFHAGDGQQQMLSNAQVLGVGGVFREASNRFRILIQSCTAVPILDMETQTTYTTSSGWVHLLAAWDLANGRADLYVNDVNVRETNVTAFNSDLCYASLRWGIGGISSAQLDADVADLYAALGVYLDLEVEANRRKFSDAAGRPVDLGGACRGPTGAEPTGCFVGEASTWNVNEGIGKGFNLEGDGLAMAPTSPSD